VPIAFDAYGIGIASSGINDNNRFERHKKTPPRRSFLNEQLINPKYKGNVPESSV
jgi:hypothetical protein